MNSAGIVLDDKSLAPAPTYDLIIVGGGIVGAGIARDATLRGMKVALFEKCDFGSGTSSKSSKLIHGGLRYLEQGELGLVFESVSERRVQTKVAPHLVRPQPFLVPIYPDTKPGLEITNVGLWLYDSLAMFRAPRMHRTFRGARAARELEPELRSDGLRGVIEYYDCATDDSRLTLENILDAEHLGATCHSYTEVARLIRDAGGRVRGVVARDVFTGVEIDVHSRAVVIAAGAWTDEAIKRFEIPIGRELLRRTKGVHLVVPHELLPIARAITMMSPIDDRVMFAIPWRERTVLGTTDTDFTGTADEVFANAADVNYLCDSANRYFAHAKVTPNDVIATWAGLRPLIRNEAGSASSVSREHEVFTRDDGLVLIAGGKLTTYRRMAKDCVTAAVKWLRRNDGTFDADAIAGCTTKHRPLPGALGLSTVDLDGVAAIGRALIDDFGLDGDSATHLCGVYGIRATILGAAIKSEPSLGERINADLPYLWAEVDFAVLHDRARAVTDVLARRAPLSLVGRDQGLDVAPRVADRMAELLGWDAATRGRHLAAYSAEIEHSRRFRTS